ACRRQSRFHPAADTHSIGRPDAVRFPDLAGRHHEAPHVLRRCTHRGDAHLRYCLKSMEEVYENTYFAPNHIGFSKHHHFSSAAKETAADHRHAFARVNSEGDGPASYSDLRPVPVLA